MLFRKKNKSNLLISLLLITACTGYGQSVKGTVEGQGEGLLTGATVILYEGDSATMLAFSITDAKGQWDIAANANAGMILNVSFLGYESQYLRLDARHFKMDSLHILLDKKIEKLREVIVVAERLSIVVSGDTITYDASVFRREGDRTLRDVLHKMPGVEVTSNGDINYKGKRIDKILLEGKDILADQHKLTTESIQASDIEAIKFIEQYRSFSEHYLPFNTNKVAMDIQLTEEAQKKINGDVELLGGYRYAYQSSTNLYRVREKSGLTTFARSNNVSEPVMTQGDFLSMQGNFFKVLNKTKGDFSQIIPEGFNTTSDVQRNLDNIILTNYELNQNQDTKLRFATMGNYSRRETASDIERIFIQTQSTQDGGQTRQISFPYLYSKMDLQKRFPNKKSIFMLELPVYADLTSNERNYNGDIVNLSTENTFRNNQHKFRMSPEFNYSKQLSQNIRVFVEANGYLESLKKQILLKQAGSADTIEISQSNKGWTGLLHSKFGYTNKKGNWDLGTSIEASAFSRAIALHSPEVSLYNANFQHLYLNPKTETTSRYEKGPWMGEAVLAVEHNRHHIDTLKYQNVLGQSSLSLRYKFSALHFILLKIAFAQLENPHDLAYGTFELQDENTIRHSSLKPGSYLNSSSLNLNYFWFNRDKRILINTFINYLHSRGASFQDFQVENGFIVQSYIQSDNNLSFMLRNDLSWKWTAKDIRFQIGTILKYTQFETPYYENMNQQFTDIKLGVYYEPKSDVEIGYSYGVGQQRRIWEGAKQTFLTQTHNLNAVYTKNTFRIKGAVNHQKLKNTDISNQFATLDMRIDYHLKKNWTIILNGKDLLNLAPKKIYSNKMFIAYDEISSFRRFPGSMTLGIKKLM